MSSRHLRTIVKGVGQIEIDDLYIGLDKYGCHYVIPVQAKDGKDQIGAVQQARILLLAPRSSQTCAAALSLRSL